MYTYAQKSFYCHFTVIRCFDLEIVASKTGITLNQVTRGQPILMSSCTFFVIYVKRDFIALLCLKKSDLIPCRRNFSWVNLCISQPSTYDFLNGKIMIMACVRASYYTIRPRSIDKETFLKSFCKMLMQAINIKERHLDVINVFNDLIVV